MPGYKYSKEEAFRLYRENPQKFFDEVIHAEADDERELINKSWPLFWSKYHYNMVENGIMEVMVKYELPVIGGDFLDIGSGTGHWLEFYRDLFVPRQLWGIDFAEGPLDKLIKKFGPDVNFLQWDISQRVPEGLMGKHFDLINAIGIIFHIVDDDKWRIAIKNLGALMKQKGVLIIGGDFSDTTRERGVMRKTRSLKEWETLANELQLKIMDVKRYNWWAGADREGLTNNLLVLGKL